MTAKEFKELKPCPVCGRIHAEVIKDEELYSIRCSSDECYMGMGLGKNGYYKESDAIKAWNTRK